MSEEKIKEIARDALEMRSVFAPGHYFFCRRIELPDGLENGEVEDYVVLQLENLSPFPIEHLQYGYAIDAVGAALFVYAAYRRRFDSNEVGEWEKKEVVVPDFIIALLGEERSSRELCLIADESISIVKYDSGSGLPACIRSYSRNRDEDGELIEAEVDLKNQGVEIDDSMRIWKPDASFSMDSQRCFIGATNESNSGQIEFSVKRDDLWTLDIRDANTIAKNQADDRRNNVFWKVVIATAACIALLLIGEVFYGGFALFSSYEKGVVSERQPLVDDIDDKNRIANDLVDFQDKTLAPFAMLLGVESFRPEVVYFNKVTSLGSLQLEVEAFAPSQAMANQFKTRVERSENIESVEIKNSQSQASGTRFTAILTFKPGSGGTSARSISEEVANG